MSKLSKICRQQKNIFRKQLEQFAQEQIEEFLEPNLIDQEIDAFQTESEYLESLYIQDIEDGLFSIYPDDEYEDHWNDDWSDYEDVYNNFTTAKFEVGSYYKDQNDRTFLCCVVHGEKYLINIHTGQELEYSIKYNELKKIG